MHPCLYENLLSENPFFIQNIMSKNQVVKIVKAYADFLKKNRVAFHEVYLFGSYATGRAHAYSDIDVAVVMDKVPRGKGYIDQRLKLRRLTAGVDVRIEPILLEERDLKKSTASIMGHEVLEHGILMAKG